MTKEQKIAVYEQFLKANPHIQQSAETAQRIVDRFNALAAQEPLTLNVETLTKIANDLTREDNFRVADEFVAKLDAGSYQLTLESNPLLVQALNSELSTPLDLSSIRIVSPDKVARFAGVEAEKGLFHTRKERERKESQFVSNQLGRKNS